ncbi:MULTISPECIES: macrolide family glycosyltransferase [Bacillus cereus group]|uniref:MGT family glycosyltransferase n=2 Tax=Bacillus cereus group TaxID=86661 RepID=A0A9W5K2R7_BACC8|nr:MULTISPECIES: macrolide family glycosyltransferase [Bacillus cereus group]AMR05901.1 glycosyl transferase [Bacillus thuringiensis]AYF85303.1 glycosyl transferase [Bacillus thuringiensis]EJR13797.1 MGT family glycosyltransferase [Bacillus cereus VD014]EJR74378.1 MGT family glycosyltransferase [Bacillus cereus VD156]MBJ8154093.1 glycosyl transferase [Bacillus cereus]
MAKVLMFNFPGEGHINPTIALVEELIKRGEEVIYYCVEKYRSKIENTGALFRPYENFIAQIDMVKRMSRQMDSQELLLHMVKSMDKIIEVILEEVKEEEYDYVIYDNNFAVGWIIAEVLQLPKISSCTTFAITKKIASALMKNHGEENKKSPLYQEVICIFKKWEDMYGITLNEKQNVMTCPGDITIVYTSKLYQPNVEEFDDSYIFVGPSIAQRKDVDSFSLEQEKGNKLIFISMGTVFNQQPDFYYTCFEAFRDSSVTVILAIGEQNDISQLDNIPSNFKLYNYVPQLDILQHTDLFITHGGMNSSSESLYFSVPMLVIPVMGDQPIVAQRIEELEAGVQLDRNLLTPEILRNTAIHVLSNNIYTKNSHRIGKSLKNAGGYNKAVDEIETFKFKMCIE